MYPVVISVVPQDDFTLLLVYDNNERKVFDMKLLLNQQPFSALTDKNLFLKVKTSFDTIEWENEIDITLSIFMRKVKKFKIGVFKALSPTNPPASHSPHHPHLHLLSYL